jgi:hypothetical protein
LAIRDTASVAKWAPRMANGPWNDLCPFSRWDSTLDL